jgi:hypothetical protein
MRQTGRFIQLDQEEIEQEKFYDNDKDNQEIIYLDGQKEEAQQSIVKTKPNCYSKMNKILKSISLGKFDKPLQLDGEEF